MAYNYGTYFSQLGTMYVGRLDRNYTILITYDLNFKFDLEHNH